MDLGEDGIPHIDEGQLDAGTPVAPIVSVQNRQQPPAGASWRGSTPRQRRRRLQRGRRSPLAGSSSRSRPIRAPGRAWAAWNGNRATPAQVTVWVLRSQAVFAIPGTSSSAHLEENLGARGLELTDEDVAELASKGFPPGRARRFARRARARAGRARLRR